jgi:hypothetical protein
MKKDGESNALVGTDDVTVNAFGDSTALESYASSSRWLSLPCE